jgi:hypothetical protein
VVLVSAVLSGYVCELVFWDISSFKSVERQPTFRNNIPHPSSGSKNKPELCYLLISYRLLACHCLMVRNIEVDFRCCIVSWIVLLLIFSIENGDSMSYRNVGNYKTAAVLLNDLA